MKYFVELPYNKEDNNSMIMEIDEYFDDWSHRKLGTWTELFRLNIRQLQPTKYVLKLKGLPRYVWLSDARQIWKEDE